MEPYNSENGWREWRGVVDTRLENMESLLKEVRDEMKPMRAEVIRIAAVISMIVAAIAFAASRLVKI